jgi:uncharacterized membrane protein YdfJ with MMPL/SSD domain
VAVTYVTHDPPARPEYWLASQPNTEGEASMQRITSSLADLIGRRRWMFIGAWIVVLLAAVPFALRQSDHLTGGGFNVPGSQAEDVRIAMSHGFAGGERSTLGLVLLPSRPHAGAATTVTLDRALREATKTISRTAHVPIPPSDLNVARDLAARGGTVLMPIPLKVSADRSIDVATHLRTALEIDGRARRGVTTHLIGQGALWAEMQHLSKHGLASAEQTGFPIVLVILLAVFGSLAAAALPLALGAVSVTITGALIYLLSQAMVMSVFVTNMASMIGIGVAVDYSLFVLARYREEIAAGAEPAAARATALSTSGVAVIFSGMTVIVSLAGLWMVDNAAVRSMALGAMMVVAVSVLAAATLLPALLALLGHRAAGQSRVFNRLARVATRLSRRRPQPDRPGFWVRWTRRVTRRPALTAIGSAAILLVLAIPALSLQIGTGALQQFAPGNETRVGFEAAARVAGPGATSPLFVLASFRDDARASAPDRATISELRHRIAADPVVATVTGVELSRSGHQAVITATPRVPGESTSAKRLVSRLRAQLPTVAQGRATVEVGGTTAQQRDFSHLISGSMWKIVLFVLALSYLVLLILLRSVLLPLKAVVMNLLSVGASYGALVAVFQWGWLHGLLGVHQQGHLDALTPPLVLAVVFGLSMDYEVFLLTRIRERFGRSGDPRGAVAEGLASSARTITSAALIMASVFAVFMGTGIPSIQELGLGNAVAVAIDATLVRLVLVPATMELLGHWNWWLPRGLERILPSYDLEGSPAPA